MHDARRGQFDVLLVWAFDRLAPLVKHFLEVLVELSRLNIEFISFRETWAEKTTVPLLLAIVALYLRTSRELTVEGF